MTFQKTKLAIIATLLFAVGLIFFQYSRWVSAHPQMDTVDHSEPDALHLAQSQSPATQTPNLPPERSPELTPDVQHTSPGKHPRWPNAVVQDYRSSPSADSDITIREWILDNARPDLPIKVVEKVAFQDEPKEEILSYLEMAANRVLIFTPTDEPTLLAGQFPGAEFRPLAEGVMTLTASVFDLDTVDRLMKEAQASDTVTFAEPDYIVRPSLIPNDPRFSSQWGLNNTRSSGADIDAPEAWNVRTNASGVIIAVIDSGLRTSHEDIRSNLWSNPSEVFDGIDNDRNGIVDDVNGFNAVSRNGSVSDSDGHGTHVAGIAGAQGNNGVGITGVAWDVQIMPIKFIQGGSGSSSDAIESIDYAIAKGADVINASWGGPGASSGLAQAISRARSAGIPFIAAAGNDGANNDTVASYPANFTFDNIVSVGSSTSSDTPSSFSNFGSKSVDVFAPGSGIISTWYTSNSAYQSLSGTSMAAPMVSGVVALVAAQFPQESYRNWIQRVIAGVDRPSSLQGLSVSGGRVNLSTILDAPDSASPPVITSGLSDQQLSVGDTLSISVSVTGTQPLTYTWSRNNSAIPGQGSPTLTLNNVQINDSGTYQVLVSNTAGVAASSAEVLVAEETIPIGAAFDERNRDFLISGDASWQLNPDNAVVGDQSIKSGPITDSQSSSIQTNVIGPGTLCFWWRVSSEQNFDFLSFTVNDTLQARISGETSWQQVCFELNSGLNTIRWDYTKDSQLSTGDDAGYLDGFDFTVPDGAAPEIIHQPISQVVSFGASARFTVIADPADGVVYQWFKNGSQLVNNGRVNGVSSSTLIIDSVSATDKGLYLVSISNSLGSQTSSPSQLTVSDALQPRILKRPEGATVGVSADLTLSVDVDGSAPFSYEWYKNASPIPGENQKDLTLSNASLDDSGDYVVKVSNRAGSIESDSAEVRVIEVSILPVFLKHPLPAFLKVGESLSLSVVAGGATPRTIQWYKDDVKLNGETTDELIITDTTIKDSGNYSAEVSNSFGTTTSRTAPVAVLSQTEAPIVAINGEETGITLENTGGPGWFPQSKITDSDSLAMRSGDVDAQSSSTMTSYIVGPGTVFFRWKVSSEIGNDFLQFRVGGTTWFSISGEHEWETRSFELFEGVNRLDWVYVKNATNDAGEDAGFLDRIFLSDGASPLNALSYFPGSVNTGNGWLFIPEIEFLFGGTFRWVYHPEHQWWYLFGTGGNATWIYDLGLGWIHTTSNDYPSIFSARENAWIFYDVGSTNPRIFINIATQETVDGGF